MAWRYIINLSSPAIHYNTGSYPLGCGTLTKNSAALLLQKAADESDLSKTQIISFHPSAILSLVGKGAGLTADSADWDHEDLPGSFDVWAASLEAAFLRSRFV
ncbi:short-chain dehydrogenase [Fusarium oxysporum f. sp. phaseoli]